MTRWAPTATRATLVRRARMLDAARAYFSARDVLEVETPVAVGHAITDPQLASFALASSPARHLHTSPEHAMKRLLAAGSGDVFQVCHVFRDEERSRLHNPEFTMIEWYRTGFDLGRIIEDTAALLNALLEAGGSAPRPLQCVAYREAFAAQLGIDPLDAAPATLRDLAAGHGLATGTAATLDRDGLLDFLMAVVVGPRLGHQALCALHHYPASQAALAQLDPDDPATALRFELYADGIELANGYVELADPAEQQRRFEADRALRLRLGRPAEPHDERLVAALQAGMPDCAGVALGFDRVVMLAQGARSIDEVIAFPWEDA